jgi:hypothetical protein
MDYGFLMQFLERISSILSSPEKNAYGEWRQQADKEGKDRSQDNLCEMKKSTKVWRTVQARVGVTFKWHSVSLGPVLFSLVFEDLYTKHTGSTSHYKQKTMLFTWLNDYIDKN